MLYTSIKPPFHDKYPIYADLHTHSISSGHCTTDTITDLIKAARGMGLQILGISEHGPATPGSAKPSYFRGLTLASHNRQGLHVVYGVELNITNIMGDVDLNDSILSSLDYAIISIHSPMLTPYKYKDFTDTYINAMNHPKVKFLGHIDDSRFPVNYERLLKKAKENSIYPEINNCSLMPNAYRKECHENSRKILEICKKIELPILLSSDSHGKTDVGNMKYIYPLLDASDFPHHLILNSFPDKIRKILIDC